MISDTRTPGNPGGELDRVHENPRPYGEKRLKDAIKEEVPVETLADDLGAELRRTGKGLRGLCPIHGGRNREAFCVYPDGGWWCFNCGKGGDVIDLWMRAKNCFDFKLALIDLAGQYGVQAPPRPERWHAWQSEKDRRRDGLREIRARLYQRRMLLMYADDLARIEDPEEREAQARQVFAELYGLARTCAEWKAGQ